MCRKASGGMTCFCRGKVHMISQRSKTGLMEGLSGLKGAYDWLPARRLRSGSSPAAAISRTINPT